MKAAEPALDALPERFEVEALLGAGSYGTVYRVFDRERRARVALKLLHRSGAAPLLRFKREFRALADLRHENLLSLYELFADEARWFFTMELIDGVPITEVPRDRGSLQRAFTQLASGLEALHGAGQLHRDLKPSNVMVERGGRVVVLDFGFIADTADASTDLVGTPAHASPEQLAGAPIDPRSDWYAFGSILFETLTGAAPFEGRALEVMARKQREPAPRLLERAPDAPPRWAKLVDGLLSRDPSERPRPSDVLAAFESSARADDSSEEPPLVGRAGPLEALERAFVDARDAGEARFVWIEGASGVGKTALLRAFAARHAADAWVLSGRCYEQESVPHKALDGAFDSLTQTLTRLPRAERDLLLDDDLSHASLLFPVLARVEGLRAAPAVAYADPPRQREIAVHALHRLLLSVSRARPIVIAVDDLQWADADSALLLRDLIEAGPMPLLFLGAHRPLRHEASPFFASTSVEARAIALAPLDRAEAIALARALLPGADGSTLEAVADESGGLPFLLGELCRHARAHGPRRVRAADVTSDRLARLTESERGLLELLSVAGHPLPTRWLAETETGFDEALADGLRRDRWVQLSTLPDGHAIATYHDRLAEAVRGGVTDDRRRDLHGRLGDLLARQPDAEPEAVAVHFERAGREAEATRFVTRAAERAARALAWDRAVRLYRRALELHGAGDRRRLQIALGDALAGAGRGPEAAETYRLAGQGAEGELSLELERRVADQLLRAGHLDAGHRALDAVLRSIGSTLQRSPRTAIASLLYHRARLELRGFALEERDERECDPAALREVDVLFSAGIGLSFVDSVRGADFLARSLLRALELGEPTRVARSLAYEACFVSNRGVAAQAKAEARLASATAIARRRGDEYLRALCLGAECIVSFHAARWERSASAAERAEQVFSAQPVGLQREVSSVRFFWAVTQILLGRFDALAGRLPDLVRNARERGDIFSAVNFRSGFPNLLWLARDDEPRAREEAAEAMRDWPQSGFHVQHFCDLYARVSHELYAGEAEQALAVTRAHWRDYERSLLSRLQFIRVTCVDLRARAHLAAAVGRPWRRPARLREVHRAVRGLRGEGVEWARAMASMLEAGATCVADRAASVSLYAEAAASFERARLPVHALSARRAGALAAGRDPLPHEDGLRSLGVVRPGAYADMLAPR